MDIIYSFICAFLPCIIYFIIRKKKGHKLPVLLMFIFVLYIWKVYDLTGAGGLNSIIYAPKGGDNESIIQATINLVPFNVIEKTFYLNILMFIPLGFLVPFIWENYRKIYKIVLLGTSFSLLIELSQLITNRTTDINDLIANTIGALLGYIIWKIFILCFGKHLKNATKGYSDVICYILFSFLGLFFLCYPFWFEWKVLPIFFG